MKIEFSKQIQVNGVFVSTLVKEVDMDPSIILANLPVIIDGAEYSVVNKVLNLDTNTIQCKLSKRFR